jgi:hypothetical protein
MPRNAGRVRFDNASGRVSDSPPEPAKVTTSSSPGPQGTLEVALSHAAGLLQSNPALALAQAREILEGGYRATRRPR